MRRLTLIIITCSILAIAGLAALVQQSIGRPSVSQVPRDEGQPRRKRVELIHTDLPALRTPDFPPPDIAQAAEPARPNPEAPPPPLDRVALAARMDAAFERERPDPAWAPGAIQQVTSVLGTALSSHGKLGRVDCRHTSCRVELTLSTGKDLSSVMHEQILASRDNGLWNGRKRFIVVDDQPGKGTSVIAYLARAGSGFPDVGP